MTPPPPNLVVTGSAAGLVAGVDGLVIEAGGLVTVPKLPVLVVCV